MGLRSPPEKKIGEGDDGEVEYLPAGEFKPPAWTSEKARPKKSCLRTRGSVRFAPYPNPSTRPALDRRSTEDIDTSLDEALTNRILLNYEGPNALAIRNETSVIYVPGEEPFSWKPDYTGPPAESSDGVHQLVSEATTNIEAPAASVASSSQSNRKNEVVVGPVPQSASKKRRYVEDDDDAPSAHSRAITTEGSPMKRLRTTNRLPKTKLPTPTTDLPTPPSPSSPSLPTPSSISTDPLPSPASSSSSTGTLTLVDSSSSDGDGFSPISATSSSEHRSPSQPRFTKKKLRFKFTDPSSIHPKFGVPDSPYLHYSRAKSQSKKARSSKKSKAHIPRNGDWTKEAIEEALTKKRKWDKMRQRSLWAKTCRKALDDSIEKVKETDASAEHFQKLVDRYEAGWPAIDLAGVRARYIRPIENEVRGENNRERIKALGPTDRMRRYYPSWDHPAWEAVDSRAIFEWENSPHYKLRQCDVLTMVLDEDAEVKRANAEPDVATEPDEDDDAMRREFVAAEEDETEAAEEAAVESELLEGAPTPFENL
ncbi:hypothetical protein FRC01_012113 [Tulasnella sp. 417]|nr:hypothetical protein FRC01_012113 [Tulasnella sp. 417]